jgi:hypothetical protein
MLNLRRGALAALLALVSCGGHDPYPAAVVDRFLASCVGKLPAGQEGQRAVFAASCRCMLDRLQGKYSLEQFNALETRMANGGAGVQEELAPIVAECRGKVAATPP